MPDPDAPRRLFRNAKREAFIVAIVWAITLVWSVGYCYLFGYQHDGNVDAKPRPPGIVLGFPDWIFWGIMLPWVLASAFTVWFGLWGMADDDLGADTHEAEPKEGGEGHGH